MCRARASSRSARSSDVSGTGPPILGGKEAQAGIGAQASNGSRTRVCRGLGGSRDQSEADGGCGARILFRYFNKLSGEVLCAVGSESGLSPPNLSAAKNGVQFTPPARRVCARSRYFCAVPN